MTLSWFVRIPVLDRIEFAPTLNESAYNCVQQEKTAVGTPLNNCNVYLSDRDLNDELICSLEGEAIQYSCFYLYYYLNRQFTIKFNLGVHAHYFRVQTLKSIGSCVISPAMILNRDKIPQSLISETLFFNIKVNV